MNVLRSFATIGAVTLVVIGSTVTVARADESIDLIDQATEYLEQPVGPDRNPGVEDPNDTSWWSKIRNFAHDVWFDIAYPQTNQTSTDEFGFVYVKSLAEKFEVKGEHFDRNEDALRFSPADWQQYDYRRGKTMLTTRHFEACLHELRVEGSGEVITRVYLDAKAPRLGTIDFKEKLDVLGKNVREAEKATITDRTLYTPVEVFQTALADLRNPARQTCMLALNRDDERTDDVTEFQWFVVDRIERCQVRPSEDPRGAVTEAYSIELLDLDPWMHENLKHGDEARVRLFYFENSGRLSFEFGYRQANALARRNETKVRYGEYEKNDIPEVQSTRTFEKTSWLYVCNER